jgi:acetolactate synthase-1/2/3 large subunit
MAVDDRPVVIDFVVGADAQVWPMVAAGTGNDQIMAARDIRPLFEGDELVADISVESEVAAKAADPSTQEAGK